MATAGSPYEQVPRGGGSGRDVHVLPPLAEPYTRLADAYDADPATSTAGRDGSTAIATSACAPLARETFTSPRTPRPRTRTAAAEAATRCGASDRPAEGRSARSTATGSARAADAASATVASRPVTGAAARAADATGGAPRRAPSSRRRRARA